MIKAKHIDGLCIAVISITLVITVLFMFGERLGLTVVHREEDEETSAMFTANDLNADWDTDGACKITLSDNSADISGNGAYFSNGTLYIAYAGKYVISGSLNGSINIDANGDDKIWILFDGVNISSSDSAPLYVNQADKVFITLKADSRNSLVFKSTEADGSVDGAIYSRDDLTVNGSGELTVVSDNLHGIVCNDTVVFAGGSIDITAKNDGVHAHDAIKICNTSITVAAGDDGLHAGNDDGNSVFYLESGTVNITESYEGIEANDILIAGGTVNIAASDDGINANGDGTNSLITISGGDITVINKDGRDADGLDSNGSINITGGNLFISAVGTGSNSALDYGSENGGKCTISGGTVIACGGSQMAEGPEQNSSQGFIMQTVSGDENETVTLSDKNGETVISKEIPCSFTSIILSSPEIAVGDTLTLKIGDSESEVTVDNSAVGGNIMNGGKGGFAPNGGNGQTDEAPPENSENGNRPQMPNSDTNGTPPEKPDRGSSNFEKPDNSSDGSSGMPSMPNGDFPDRGSSDGQDIPQPPNMDGNPQDNPSDSSESQTTDTNAPSAATLILLAVSAAVLALGLFIAVKKKY